MKRHRWRPGDVIRVALAGEYRYLQLVGKDSNKIDVLRVLDIATKLPSADVALLGAEKTAYWMQSMCSVLTEDSRFAFVGNCPNAGAIPPLRRRFFGGWIVVNGDSEEFVASPISEEIAKISLQEGVPAQALVDRLSSGWRPQDERHDIGQQVSRYKSRARLGDGSRVTVFFIEFPSTIAATEAREELIKRGLLADYESDKASLAVKRLWRTGDSLDSMDLLELELLSVTKRFDGTISGRETTA